MAAPFLDPTLLPFSPDEFDFGPTDTFPYGNPLLPFGATPLVPSTSHYSATQSTISAPPSQPVAQLATNYRRSTARRLAASQSGRCLSTAHTSDAVLTACSLHKRLLGGSALTLVTVSPTTGLPLSLVPHLHPQALLSLRLTMHSELTTVSTGTLVLTSGGFLLPSQLEQQGPRCFSQMDPIWDQQYVRGQQQLASDVSLQTKRKDLELRAKQSFYFIVWTQVSRRPFSLLCTSKLTIL